MIKGLNWFWAGVISVFVALLPAVLFYLNDGPVASAIWLGLYGGWNITIVSQQNWVAVERLGQYHNVWFSGLHFFCLRGMIDKVKDKGGLKEVKLQIFGDPSTGIPLEEIDFTDGSAPIEAYLWCSVSPTEEDVKKYVYINDDPKGRVMQVAEDALRPILQRMSVDEASKDRATLISQVIGGIRREAAAYGIRLVEDTSVVIADIGLTAGQQALRAKRLEGQTKADEIANKAGGYRRAIEAIMYRPVLGADGKPVMGADGNPMPPAMVCSFDVAKQIWEDQQSRDTIATARANVTLVASTVQGVVGMYNAGGQSDGGRIIHGPE